MGEYVFIPPNLYVDFETGIYVRNNDSGSIAYQTWKILELFVKNEGKVVPHEDINKAAGNFNSTDDNTNKSYENSMGGKIRRVRDFLKGTTKRIIPRRGDGFIYGDFGGYKELENPTELQKSVNQPVPSQSIFAKSIQNALIQREQKSDQLDDSPQDTHGLEQQKDKNDIDERCETIDILCGRLCKGEDVDFIEESLQSQKNNINIFCQLIRRYAYKFKVSMSEIECQCQEYMSDVILKMEERLEGTKRDYKDALAQLKAEAIEVIESYFCFRIMDVLLTVCQDIMERFTVKSADKEYCEVMIEKYQREYYDKGIEYQRKEEEFRRGIDREKGYDDSAGRTK